MNLKLELDQECPRCEGMGWIFFPFSSINKQDCDHCKGDGRVPTWQGIELLAFIDTYKDWMEDD